MSAWRKPLLVLHTSYRSLGLPEVVPPYGYIGHQIHSRLEPEQYQVFLLIPFVRARKIWPTSFPIIQRLVPLFNFFFFLVPTEGKGTSFCQQKPSSFSICPSLPELRLLSLHSKTFLLPLQARLYMPKNPICTLFSALKKGILEVTKDVLWAKKN